MNERISELIDELKSRGIKQYAFAEALGVTETAVSAWKNGRRNITEQTIKAICREFKVDYIWLTTGVGEMFVSFDDDETMELVDRIMSEENEFTKTLIKTLLNLDLKDIEALERILDQYIEQKGTAS